MVKLRKPKQPVPEDANVEEEATTSVDPEIKRVGAYINETYIGQFPGCRTDDLLAGLLVETVRCRELLEKLTEEE